MIKSGDSISSFAYHFLSDMKNFRVFKKKKLSIVNKKSILNQDMNGAELNVDPKEESLLFLIYCILEEIKKTNLI